MMNGLNTTLINIVFMIIELKDLPKHSLNEIYLFYTNINSIFVLNPPRL